MLGEDCRPVISFDIPVNGFPENTNKYAKDYSEWMGENEHLKYDDQEAYNNKNNR